MATGPVNGATPKIWKTLLTQNHTVHITEVKINVSQFNSDFNPHFSLFAVCQGLKEIKPSVSFTMYHCRVKKYRDVDSQTHGRSI